MFAIPTLGGVRMSAYSAGGGIWDSPNRAEVFRRPPRWIRGSAGKGGIVFREMHYVNVNDTKTIITLDRN